MTQNETPAPDSNGAPASAEDMLEAMTQTVGRLSSLLAALIRRTGTVDGAPLLLSVDELKRTIGSAVTCEHVPSEPGAAQFVAVSVVAPERKPAPSTGGAPLILPNMGRRRIVTPDDFKGNDQGSRIIRP